MGRKLYRGEPSQHVAGASVGCSTVLRVDFDAKLFLGETTMLRSFDKGTRKGFTLVELAVVIVIIGVLAAFGVPRFLKSVERSKASEAFAYLSAVRAAQERYVAKEGKYATVVSALDINQSSLKYFKNSANGAVSSTTAMDSTGSEGGVPSWKLTLIRDSSTSSYGQYTVVFTQNGFDGNSTILSSTCRDISPLDSGYSSGS
jgi:prepilin-type N-terminal cleavage/methylation domain-containing protein